METISSQKCFGGTISIFKHPSTETACDMRFSLFVPPKALNGPVPVLFWLSGLTCTEENFTTKAGAYKRASELGIAILAPDTSPRGDDVHDEAGYDIGKGAGFYVDAAQGPWAKHYRMESYVVKELPALLRYQFPALDHTRMGIFGHSMGGHGALTLFLRHRGLFKSVSAFAPIVAPSIVPWGEKAFTAYLGADKALWKAHDACALIEGLIDKTGMPPILVDQGTADQFLRDQLKPEKLEAACKAAGLSLTLRMLDGYDHSYFFIQSFIDDHLDHHAKLL
jgi:S-formylglutathione hydrolase